LPLPVPASSDPGLGPAEPDPGLPPYSPDLNPIEQAFAKLKTCLRQAAVRSRGTLWSTIRQLITTFSPTECTHYLRNAGYAAN
jgi:transposase